MFKSLSAVRTSCCFLLFLTSPLFAQVTPISESSFNGQPVELDFQEQQTGASSGSFFEQWGVSFEPSGDNELVIGQETVAIIGATIRFLGVDETGGSSVVANLVHPARQIGFYLRGDSGTTARLTFFDQLGNNLGFVEKTGLSGRGGTFLGGEVMGGPGFTKVRISYASAASPVQFSKFRWTHVQRPVFRTYLAQVADGSLGPGAGALQSVVIIANLANTTAVGEVRIFGDDGNPLSMVINGQARSVIPLSIDPYGSVKLETAANAFPPVQGYMSIESDTPLAATAIFRIINGAGGVASEAGVGGDSPRNQVVAVMTREVMGDFNTGIAAANPGTESASAIVRLLGPDGQVIRTSDALSLGPGEHTAVFLSSLFPGEIAGDFDGSLLISSDQPIVLTVIRTASGLVLSSLPVGSTQR